MNRILMIACAGVAGCWAPSPELPSPPDAATIELDAGPYVCGPSSCAGCCELNRCRSGRAEEACGQAGGACAYCAIDELCQTGRCESQDPRRYGGPGEGSGEAGEKKRCTYWNGVSYCP